MGFRLFLVNLLFALAIHETEGTVTSTLEDQVTDMSKALNDFVNTNLGVDQLQDHLSKITSKKKTQEGSEILRKFHDSLEEKVRKANQTLEELIDVIKNDFKGPGDGDDKPITSCCDYDARKTTYSNLFKNWVNFDDVCGYASVDHNLCPNQLRTLEDKVHRLTQSVMLEKMKEAYNKHGKGSSRHIYLGTTDGYFLGYPADRSPEEETMCNCSAFDPRYRPWYPNLVNTKEGKEFVIVLDYSSKMKGDLLKQAKKVVHNLLRIIDGKDKIVLRIISGGNSIAPSEFDCLKFLTEARPSVIKVLKDFLDRTGQTGLLEYAKVFRDSFRLFGSSNKKKLFILITSGEHDESYSQVKEYYKNGYQKACQASVVIFLVQGSSTPLITRQEHEGLKQEGCDACNDQNCDSFNKFQLVDIYPRYNEADIRQQVAKIYKAFQNELGPPQLQFSMPYEDFYGLGTMIDACTRVVSDDNKLLGVLCLSFLSNELFGVTAEVANTKDAYPFLIDKSGTTYIHPYYINPELHASGSRIDITNFETSIQFQNQVYNSMKSGGEDEKSFKVESSVPLGTLGAKFESKNFTYIWREVEGSSFSVGVAVSSVYKDDLQLQSLTTKGNELYHRLSLQDGIQDELCSHYGYIAIKDQPVVSIAPDSFEQPSVYYEKESKETVKTLQNYFNETYVENPTAFKSNTIRNEIRQAVMATNLMNKIWTGDESNQRLIIKWRYIGMENGVFRIFPGIEIPEFDPRQQQWYHLAETFPGKLVFTTPYKDSNDPSQASILSLSKQITEELSGVKQGSGVIGMDFEFRYFQFLIERDLTLCAGKVIRGTCSIINTDGFLLYHNGTDGDLYKHIHLVEKEPNVARKLLQSGIMKKTSCIEYNDRLPRTIWFYSLDDVTVSQSDNGTFWLVPIKGTNLLLLFTKHSNVEKEQEECECSKPSLKGEVLGKCREGVDEASCDCPCYVEKACLSDLFETDAQRQSTLICQPRSMGQKMPDSTHLKNLMKDKMPLDECYPLNCSHFQRSDECNLYGCFWNAQQCSDVQRPTTTKNPTTDEQGGDSDDNTTIIIIVVVVVVVLIILIVIIACVVKRRKRQSTPSQDHHLKPPLPPHPPTYSETIVNRYEEEFHA